MRGRRALAVGDDGNDDNDDDDNNDDDDDGNKNTSFFHSEHCTLTTNTTTNITTTTTIMIIIAVVIAILITTNNNNGGDNDSRGKVRAVHCSKAQHVLRARKTPVDLHRQRALRRWAPKQGTEAAGPEVQDFVSFFSSVTSVSAWCTGVVCPVVFSSSHSRRHKVSAFGLRRTDDFECRTPHVAISAACQQIVPHATLLSHSVSQLLTQSVSSSRRQAMKHTRNTQLPETTNLYENALYEHTMTRSK